MKGDGRMKEASTIMEALEDKIASIPPGKTVKLPEIVNAYKEPKYIEAAKMLLKKYGVEYTKS